MHSKEANNEIPKEIYIKKYIYISPQERYQIIDELRLIESYNIAVEYQKIANLMDDASNQPSKFIARNWVEINDKSRGTYNTNSQMKFKTTMLKSSVVMHISL